MAPERSEWAALRGRAEGEALVHENLPGLRRATLWPTNDSEWAAPALTFLFEELQARVPTGQ